MILNAQIEVYTSNKISHFFLSHREMPNYVDHSSYLWASFPLTKKEINRNEDIFHKWHRFVFFCCFSIAAIKCIEFKEAEKCGKSFF